MERRILMLLVVALTAITCAFTQVSTATVS